jgi:transposase InsO family protein
MKLSPNCLTSRHDPVRLLQEQNTGQRTNNRVPNVIRERIVQLALDEPELSPWEFAKRFTDTAGYFVSEASVYRLLKAHDRITSPAYFVMKAVDEFKDKTTAPSQLWLVDVTYLKVIDWGWFYLSTVLDDFSRHIIAWKLCTTMKAQNVTTRWILLSRPQAVFRGGSSTSHACSATMVPATSRLSWQNGWM